MQPLKQEVIIIINYEYPRHTYLTIRPPLHRNYYWSIYPEALVLVVSSCRYHCFQDSYFLLSRRPVGYRILENGTPMGSIVKAAVAEGVMTFVWVFFASTVGACTSVVATYFGVQADLYANLFITTFIIVLHIFFFDTVGGILGGASFNLAGTLSFYTAGVGDDDLLSMAFRLPAQTAGAVGGVLAILEYMPKKYNHMLDGPSMKVDVHTGALMEGFLTFLISLAVLWIILHGPRNYIVKTVLISISTVIVVVAGSGFTGPSMNPANAFAWAYVKNNHDTWEQFYVYWICPLIGSILAGWVFRILFPPKEVIKEKRV